jgi:translocation and assembly module TamB
MQRMRTIAKWIGATLGAVVLALLLLFYTPPGLKIAGNLVAGLSGGAVRITGLSGLFPNHLRVARVEVADDQGVWLSIDQAALDWSALAMFSNHLAIDKVTADRVVVLRRPIPSGKSSGQGPRVDIAALELPRVEIGAPVIGHAAGLSASGAVHYSSRHDLNADLLVVRLGNADRYRIAGGITADIAHGNASISEGADGILGKLVGLPGLGPVNLSARAAGDAGANQVHFILTAGALKASGQGTISLASQRADLDMRIAAPKMTLRPDIAWQVLAGEAHLHGGFSAPAISAHLALTDGMLGGQSARSVVLDVKGDSGVARLTGQVDGIALPDGYDALLGKTPVVITAQADLKAATVPVKFTIRHALAQLNGTARLRGATQITADLAVPSLAPFAALEKTDLQGSASFHVGLSQNGPKAEIAVSGRMAARGTALLARMLGSKATLAMNATMDGPDLTQSHVQMKGAGFAGDVQGSFRKGDLRYHFALNLPDVSRLTPTLNGTVALTGDLRGPLSKAALTANGSAFVATRGFARQRIGITLAADDLPALKRARLALEGQLDQAPVALHATLTGDKAKRVALDARWRSLTAKADLSIAQSLVAGNARIALGQLGDIAVFTGQAIQGTANVALTLKPQGAKSNAQLVADLHDLMVAGVGVHSATLRGDASDLFGKPVLNVSATADGVAAQGFIGHAEGDVHGGLERLAIALRASMKDITGAALTTNTAAALDVTHKQLTVAKLAGAWRGVPLKLSAPTHIDLADGLAFDHIAATLGHGSLAASGRVMPQLALTASARGIALQDFQSFLPQQQIQGSFNADATLHGTMAAPIGQVSLSGRDLRSGFAGRAVPPAGIEAKAQLTGEDAMVNVTVTAGNNARLTLDGTAPIAPGRSLALHAVGNADLVLLDPFLAADGRRARGQLAIDVRIGGTVAAPRVTGGGRLANGEFQDYARGLRLHDIVAAVSADGAHIALTQLTAQAGKGTLSGLGSVDLEEPGRPVDINVHAENARPIVSDLVSATLSGDVKLSGHLNTASTLSGKLQVIEGEINLPEKFPPEVVVLNVRRRGEKPPPPPAPAGRMALDVDLRTAGPVYVRGHGLDAEMRGDIQVRGTSTAPDIGGGLRMNRGRYSVAGQTLDFTTGRIRFDGIGVRGRLDPTLDFVAETVSGGVTATLTVSGYASAPKIVLSSTPSLPQDEVVAHLLFQQSTKQLTPLQLASLGQGLAAMGGVGGGFNPLGTVRNTLGLDRLSVGSTQGGASGTQSQTTVEAGRYVARNVYVGVKQNLSGGTQTQVQFDIIRRLKAQATINTGATTAPVQGNALQDNGNSVGLSYQFDY